MRKKYHVAAALAAALLLTACGNPADTGTKMATNTVEKENAGENAASKSNADASDDADDKNDTSVTNNGETNLETFFSQRDLSGAYEAENCVSVTLSDSGSRADSPHVVIGKNGNADTVTITSEGDYMLSGSLSDGMIIVDVDKTEKVQLVLNGVDVKSSSSAALYVKQADKAFVTLAAGTANALANGGSFVAIDENNIDGAIFSKDDLTLNGTGSLTIDSPAGHGIVSKNELTIADGSYEVAAFSHGLTGKDSVAIAGGSFLVTAGEDAIKSNNSDDVTMGSVHIFGGTFTLNAVSDGINALNEIDISGGKVTVTKSDEGLEARVINISGGETDITSADDGLNATDKRAEAAANAAAETKSGAGTQAESGAESETSDKTRAKSKTATAGAGTGRGFGGGAGGMDEAGINISGGIVRVDAAGDGLDSNGHLSVSGGEVYVAGPLNNGDSALDFDIDAVISGGTVVAAGPGGMAQNFGSGSTQGTILINTAETNAAGSEIALLDSAGRQLVSWTAEKDFNSVVISCPEIQDGETYTVRTGETDTSVTMDGLVYGQGGSFGGGHGGGKRGMMDGVRPERAPGQTGGEKPGKAQMPSGSEEPENLPAPSDGEGKIPAPFGEDMEGANNL